MPNVITDPLIAVHTGGRAQPVGLHGLFTQAHDLHGLSGYVPPAEAALMRLLVALAARITGLDVARSPDRSWDERRDAVLKAGRFDPDRIAGYFDRYADRFELFDPARPFLQDPRLAHECPAPTGINRLIFYRATGNTQPWSCHVLPSDRVPVSVPEALGWLAAQHYYGPAGGGTSRAKPKALLERTGAGPKVKKAEDALAKAEAIADPQLRAAAVRKAEAKVAAAEEAENRTHYLKAGPLRGTNSIFLWDRDLFRTLVLNIPHPELTDAPDTDDVAPWETDTLPGTEHAPRVTWPMGLLVGRSRHALLLVPDETGTQVVDCYLTWAHLEQPPHAMDPYLMHWAPKKDGEVPTPPLATTSRPPWRDLPAILGPSTDDTRMIAPQVIRQTSGLPGHVVAGLGLKVLTFEQDRQTRDTGWSSALTPPVLRWTSARDPIAAQRADTLAEAAAEVANGVRRTLVAQWEQVFQEAPTRGNQKTCCWAEDTLAIFWPRAEELFWQLMDNGTVPEPRPTTPFAALAVAALREATNDWAVRPRVIDALASAERYITAMGRQSPAQLRKADPVTTRPSKEVAPA